MTFDEQFGQVRAFMQQSHLDFIDRCLLWSVLIVAAETDSERYHAEWVPYMVEFAHHWRTPLAVVPVLEEAQKIAPFATFEQSLIPLILDRFRVLEEFAPPILNITIKPPVAFDTMAEQVRACELELDAVMLNVFTFCNGFTVEWYQDLNTVDEEDELYDSFEVFLKHFELFGLSSYLNAVEPNAAILDEFEEAIDYQSFTSVPEVSREELEIQLSATFRMIGTLSSNQIDSSGTDYDSIIQDVRGTHPFNHLMGEHYATFYFGTCMLEGETFTVARDIVDSEIIEVCLCDPQEISLVNLFKGYVCRCFDAVGYAYAMPVQLREFSSVELGNWSSDALVFPA